MKINDIYPSKYLSAADLKGRDVPAIIDRVEMELFEQEQKQKPIVFFKKAKKGLVLNKTNFQSIATIAGEDTDDWPGHEIVMYSAMVNFKGQTTEAIRVRRPAIAPEPASNSEAPSKDELLDDDIPF